MFKIKGYKRSTSLFKTITIVTYISITRNDSPISKSHNKPAILREVSSLNLRKRDFKFRFQNTIKKCKWKEEWRTNLYCSIQSNYYYGFQHKKGPIWFMYYKIQCRSKIKLFLHASFFLHFLLVYRDIIARLHLQQKNWREN